MGFSVIGTGDSGRAGATPTTGAGIAPNVFQLGLVNQAAWNPTMRTLTSHHDFRTVWYVRSIVASLLGKRLSCHSFVWDEIWRREQLEHLTRPRLKSFLLGPCCAFSTSHSIRCSKQ
jgi:hypothetical protein